MLPGRRERIGAVNGVHDLAGMHGFGPVPVHDGEAFHEEWERRFFGVRMTMQLAHGFPPTIDENRAAVESLPPHVYIPAAPFERWLLSGNDVYVRRGAFTWAELEAKQREVEAHPDAPLPSHEDPELARRVVGRLRTGGSAWRTVEGEPRFAAGDEVRTRNVHTQAHTRLPRYLRGRRGTVDRLHGGFELPERASVGEGGAEYVYEVRFEGEELWGDSAEPNTCVYAQLWESYLLPA
jgi:nitrile hydratase